MPHRPSSPVRRSAGSAGDPGPPRQRAVRGPAGGRLRERAARAERAERAPRRRPRAEGESRSGRALRLLSVRALVLAVVVLSAFTLLFPTVRAYLGQRAELDALGAQVHDAEQEERDLSRQLDRWSDPAYVEAQARERLGYAMPGETAYKVVDPESVVEKPVGEEPEAVPGTGPALPVGGSVKPWYASVWDSVAAAGAADVPTEGADGDTGGQG